MFNALKRQIPEVPDITQITQDESIVKKSGRVFRNAVRWFKAGVSDRLTSAWPSTPITADLIVERYQRTLVARSREQCANNDYGRNYIRLAHQNIVGPQGVMLQAQIRNTQGKLDNKICDAIEQEWLTWGKREHCDIQTKKSWRSIQRSCVVSAAKDGEFFVRIIRGAEAGDYGFALQMLDAQRCPVMYSAKLSSGRFIRQGIEFNQYGRPIAYYFDSDSEEEKQYRFGTGNYIRVPADQVIHGYLEEIVGQKRGMPWTATSLFRMKQLSEFEDSAIVNARVSANKMGFIQWKDGFGPKFEDDDEIQIESQAGEFTMLPEGAELKEWSPNYPTGEFLPFHKAMLRSMSAGMGVLYNNLASDLEGVNFSSIRQGTLDEREHWKELQQWLIEALVEPVYYAWLEYALLKGLIKKGNVALKAVDIERYTQVAWQPRRWSWIDPSADVVAAEKSKNNMLTSAGAIIREQGKDPQTVWAEIARDTRAMIDELVAQDISKETAEEMVLSSMGRKQVGAVGRPKEGM
ncbi:phage portal protein [Acinetobacter sp. WCHAc060033]|uniref:phage portal protein n=1 Tax=Acinetobacter sp. WCHAc060033 TaxID=2518624 RepID=UPI001022B1FA|nr:phage portal protein [Acinetobacter sp. WCHAc060033]RZG78357.1 phage portal protein [Acinetobacter sp. WCHAc060033]